MVKSRMVLKWNHWLQWCSRDRNLRDRDLVKISRRDRAFTKNSETENGEWILEVQDRDSRLQNLCILPKFFKKMLSSLLTMGSSGGNGHFPPWD